MNKTPQWHLDEKNHPITAGALTLFDGAHLATRLCAKSGLSQTFCGWQSAGLYSS
jgi:hypothetical protein